MKAADFLDAEAEAPADARGSRTSAAAFLDADQPASASAPVSAAAFLDDAGEGPMRRAVRMFGDVLKTLKAGTDERWTRLGRPPAEATQEELEAAAAPARMTMTRGGQSVHARGSTASGDPGMADYVPDRERPLAEQWGGLLKPAHPRVRSDSKFAEYARRFKDVGHVGGSALELADRAGREAAADIASKDYWRNVGAAVQSVPSDWKQIMGGGLRALGESLPTAQPENPMEGGWNAVKADITAMGTDFYESAERELQATHEGLKPQFGSQAVGSAVRSLGIMLPAIATGAVTSSPAAVIGILSSTTGAKAYGEARAEGLDPGQAAAYAGLHALIEGGTEYLPIRQLFRKDLAAGKQLLNFMAREIPTEEAAVVLQAAVDKVSVRPDMTMRELVDEMAVTAVSAPLAGGVQVAAVRGIDAARRAGTAATAGEGRRDYGDTNGTGEAVSSGAQRLGEGEAAVQQSAESGLAVLRRPGSDDVDAMAAELPDVPAGRGPEASPVVEPGSDRHERRLPAGELPMGDAPTAGRESSLLPAGDGERRAADDSGGSAQPRSAADDLPQADQQGLGRDDGGTPDAGTAHQLGDADARRSHADTAAVGAGTRLAAPYAEGADPAGDASAPRADAGLSEAADKVAGDGSPEHPRRLVSADDLRAAETRVDANPTPAQKDAETYRMAHVRWQGLDISIETAKGGTRTAKDGSWSVPDFPAAYGRVKGTKGADGDHVDIFVGDNPDSQRVWVIDQVDAATGAFDEHKVMAGFRERDEALAAYDAAFADGKGPARRGAVSIVAVPQLKAWLARGTAKAPFNGKAVRARAEEFAALASAAESGRLPAYGLEEARRHAAAEQSRTGQPQRVLAHPTRPGRHAVLPEAFLGTAAGANADVGGAARGDVANERAAAGIVMNPVYTPPAEDAPTLDRAKARPDAIRQTIRDLLKVPINEGRFNKSRDTLGIYKVKPHTIRIRNQNDLGVIAHETGHHFSETSQPVRALMKEHERELRTITPYAAGQKSAALQREEGFAEYLRLAWTEPAQAKAKAPKFSAAFEAYVDKNGYRPIFNAITGAIRDWQNLPPADRILAKVGEPNEEFRKRYNLDRFIFEVLDRWLPMKRMVEDLKPDIPASADPFKLAHLLAGDVAVIEDWLLRETIPFNLIRRANLADRGKPLAEILKPVRDQTREFGAYLIARRANELMKRDKEKLYSRDEIRAGLRLETPEFRKAADEIYKFQDALLDYAVEGGLLAEHIAEKFRRFPAYVPFFRVGEGQGTKGDIFKTIKGGTANLRDPISNIIENTARIIHATNRNHVIVKAHSLARSVPGGGRWIEDVPMPERVVRVETEKVIETLREQGVEIDTEAAEHIATMQSFFVKNPFGDDRDRVIVFRRNGKPLAAQINDDMLWQALERFEPVDMGIVEKILSIPADLLRAGVTLSPDYMARNFMRDTLSGFMQSKKGLIPVAGTLTGFKEVATRSDAARLFRAFGGAYGDLWRADAGFEHELVERMARHGQFDPRTIITPRGLLSLLNRLGSITEAGTRVAEFKSSSGLGTPEVEMQRRTRQYDIDSLIDAAYDAREVSVDFGMHGRSPAVRLLTRITPFLNATMQGIYKGARTGRNHLLTTLLRGSMLTAFSVALYLMNKDEDWYDELERWERNTYWHVDIGLRSDQGDVIPIRIPKPWEWGALFGSVPEAITKSAIDHDGKEFGKRLRTVVEDQFGLRVVPTSVLVPAELWANQNTFTNRPIVPESREKLAPMLQYNQGTSQTARELGKLTDTSPAKIDHAIRGFFGTLGTYVTGMADLALTADVPEKPPVSWTRMPVVKSFVRDPSQANSLYVTDFYKFLAEARRADLTLKQLEGAEAEAYLRKHAKEIEAARDANKVSREIARLRKATIEVRESPDIPAAEKPAMIAENYRAIRLLARDFILDVERLEPAPRREEPPRPKVGTEQRGEIDVNAARIRAIAKGISSPSTAR